MTVVKIIDREGTDKIEKTPSSPPNTKMLLECEKASARRGFANSIC